MPNEFMRVDADYTAKPPDQWRASDWPRTYQSSEYGNVFAAGHRVRAAAPDLDAPHEPQRHGHRARAAPHRHALGDDRQGGRAKYRRHDPRRPRAHARRVDGRDGRRLRRLRRRQPVHRDRRLDDRLPDRPRLRALPRVRARHHSAPLAKSALPDTGSRSCCTTCSSTRHACARLAPDPRVSCDGRRQDRNM